MMKVSMLQRKTAGSEVHGVESMVSSPNKTGNNLTFCEGLYWQAECSKIGEVCAETAWSDMGGGSFCKPCCSGTCQGVSDDGKPYHAYGEWHRTFGLCS